MLGFDRVLDMGDDSALCPLDNEKSTKAVVTMFEVGDVGTSEDALTIVDVVADIEEWSFDDPCSLGDPGKVRHVASKRTEVVDNASAVSEPVGDYCEMGTSEDDIYVEETTTATSGPTQFSGMWLHEPLAEYDDKSAESQPEQDCASVIELSAREIQRNVVDWVLAVADDLVRAPHYEESPDVMMAVADRGTDGTSASDESVAATSEPTLLGGVWKLDS
jgi:hypothetical protein